MLMMVIKDGGVRDEDIDIVMVMIRKVGDGGYPWPRGRSGPVDRDFGVSLGLEVRSPSTRPSRRTRSGRFGSFCRVGSGRGGRGWAEDLGFPSRVMEEGEGRALTFVHCDCLLLALLEKRKKEKKRERRGKR